MRGVMRGTMQILPVEERLREYLSVELAPHHTGQVGLGSPMSHDTQVPPIPADSDRLEAWRAECKLRGASKGIETKHRPGGPCAQRAEVIIPRESVTGRVPICVIDEPSRPMYSVVVVLSARKGKQPRRQYVRLVTRPGA